MLGVLTADAIEKDTYYYGAKANTPTDDSACIWFVKMHVGRNTLQMMAKTMCKAVGVKGKPNHSMGPKFALLVEYS